MELLIDATFRGVRHLFYSDAAHFVLGAFICSVWSTVRMFIQSAACRNRINVLGSVHAVTKELTSTIVDFHTNSKVSITTCLFSSLWITHGINIAIW